MFPMIHGILAGAGAFSPDQIAGLQLWVDFSSLANLYQDAAKTTPVASDADPIGAVVDLSGNGRDHTQGTAGAKPTYKTAIQNSLSIARFDGGDSLAYGSGVVTGSTSRTVFFVAKTNTSGTTIAIVGMGDVGVGGGAFQITPEIAVRASGGSRVFNAGMGTTLFRIVTIKLDGTNISNTSAWLNGAALGVTSTSAIALNTQAENALGAIGSGAGVVFPFNGDLGEVIIYNAALSDGDRGLVETYLSDKWGISP